jgi:GcrA cell cycle regulator
MTWKTSAAWTAPIEQEARAMWLEAVPPAEISARLRGVVTPDQVSWRARNFYWPRDAAALAARRRAIGDTARKVSGWPAERLDQLRGLWLDGKSASEIARIFGPGFPVTRNAIMGQVHRAPWNQAARRGRAAAPARAPREPRPAKPPKAPRPPKLPPAARTAPVRAFTPPPVAAVCAPRLLVDLRACQCRFPVSDEPDEPRLTLFCASATAPGERWCAAHGRIVFSGAALKPLKLPKAA